ncbi:hypothetical protein BHM03_00055625 [Ensete ventricosum]|nr:hypothetical protein BHM03_00055625 [Ensete ventricosum]
MYATRYGTHRSNRMPIRGLLATWRSLLSKVCRTGPYQHTEIWLVRYGSVTVDFDRYRPLTIGNGRKFDRCRVVSIDFAGYTSVTIDSDHYIPCNGWYRPVPGGPCTGLPYRSIPAHRAQLGIVWYLVPSEEIARGRWIAWVPLAMDSRFFSFFLSPSAATARNRLLTVDFKW